MAVLGYARVSTDKQDSDRQRLDIYKYAEKKNLIVTKFVSETISSKNKERKIYQEIEALEKGDIIIVTELSRLGRSMIELNKITGSIIEHGAKLLIADGKELLFDGSIQGQALIFALGIGAQVERELISERTKSALKVRKDKGVILGRPIGRGVKLDTILKEKNISEAEILKYNQAGMSIKAIARLIGNIDSRTVSAWIQEKQGGVQIP